MIIKYYVSNERSATLVNSLCIFAPSSPCVWQNDRLSRTGNHQTFARRFYNQPR